VTAVSSSEIESLSVEFLNQCGVKSDCSLSDGTGCCDLCRYKFTTKANRRDVQCDSTGEPFLTRDGLYCIAGEEMRSRCQPKYKVSFSDREYVACQHCKQTLLRMVNDEHDNDWHASEVELDELVHYDHTVTAIWLTKRMKTRILK
jgi:hypothetical protein